jgi:heterotetrameric sarcosine oxidase gamma subunit
LVWSVTPGEWTVLGNRPSDEVVDLTHVRSMFRLTGAEAAELLNRICTLDLSDGMFPNGAAARTLVAGVATEVVRDDIETTPSYLILPSRSFGTYLWDVIEDAGGELDLRSEQGQS